MHTLTRRIGATLGAAVLSLLGASGAAMADPIGDPVDVPVSVEIAPWTEPGALTMSVAPGGVALTEQDTGDPTARVFTGTLPTVTVTDTRTATEIPVGASWQVVGTASDLASDTGDAIGADRLGWTPTVTDPGAVVAGGALTTGLASPAILATAPVSADAVGTWTAGADLTLAVPTTTESGSYSGTVTLTLME
jgi:hypothetical protein